MNGSNIILVMFSYLCLFLILSEPCMAGVQQIGKLQPGFRGSQMTWISTNGLFLRSNNSNFAFGFVTTEKDVTQFLLAIIHSSTLKVIWAANRVSTVANSDNFIFSEDGNVSLRKGNDAVWTPDTGGKLVSVIELQNSGNLALLGNDNGIVWQSFSHPTDTLISNQNFAEGMKLVSDPNSNSRNLSYILQIKSGDLILSAGYPTPQPYWSIQKDTRKIINKDGGKISSATIDANSWKFYDMNKGLLLQFVFAQLSDANTTWIAVLGGDGFISFYKLDGNSGSAQKIPGDPCSTPEPCGAYFVCSGSNICNCPPGLGSQPNCSPGIDNSCNGTSGSTELVSAGNGLDYFALSFVSPTSKTSLEGCRSSCNNNCSCRAFFFQNNSGNCFLFDHVGGFQKSDLGSDLVAYIKVSNKDRGSSSGADGSGKKSFPYVAIIILATILVILSLLFVAFRYYRKMKKSPKSQQDSSEDDNFLESLSGMPVRFSYRDLQIATNQFTQKLGQGGFGSVYQGTLADGTRVAVKQLEGIGQGKKEFRAEVSIIGSIHHHHLVRLKGFCAEGTHRLLAYEFMANGSLDKWIFKRNNGDFLLDWETRFKIALGTAKGLAYLHEDCDVKIIHCDIKPENVLLDDHFNAKVSDFGLAKLMTREQSNVFTTLRGTRGYLAPEWITNYAISEKSDVYSYGMLLLELIGGRKNYDPTYSSERSHFPSYAFRMMEDGKLRELLDSRLDLNAQDERVATSIKVALWCIQEDMNMRPSMIKVVQMLEGLCPVSQPPISSPLGSRLYSGLFKSISEGGTSSGLSDCNSDAFLSAVRLSGPR